MVVSYNGINSNVLCFAEEVLNRAQVKYSEALCKDYDLDRVYLRVDDDNYTIRTWNIDDKGIRFSLYRDLPTDVEDLYYGYLSHDEYAI